MLLGLELIGAFGQAPDWTIDTVQATVAKAEGAGLHFVIVPDLIAHGDSQGWPDATILLGFLGASTRRIGLIAATSTGGHQPYNLARRLASLDMISHGRIAWFLSTGQDTAEQAAFSGAIRMPDGNTPVRIAEFVRVVEGLWHGWDADALVIDKEGGQFIDPAKMHALDHQGQFFSVAGPLNVMRSPQDRPVLALRARDAGMLGGVAELADMIISDDEGAPAADTRQVRSVSAARFISQLRENGSKPLTNTVVRVASPQEAEIVLTAPPAHLTRDSGHATTLRQRLEGAAR
jgi:alkanesulfonate monooxygenase SsuD/methylene tetrahydromethanopterin reductase-like flavin-dependent oxidoreductase (luciferase family)